MVVSLCVVKDMVQLVVAGCFCVGGCTIENGMTLRWLYMPVSWLPFATSEASRPGPLQYLIFHLTGFHSCRQHMTHAATSMAQLAHHQTCQLKHCGSKLQHIECFRPCIDVLASVGMIKVAVAAFTAAAWGVMSLKTTSCFMLVMIGSTEFIGIADCIHHGDTGRPD
jgi:hypothetical protein